GGESAVERGRTLAVGDHHRDPRRKTRRGARVEQRLEVGAAARGKDADGEARRACPTVDEAHAASRSRYGVWWAHTGRRDTRRMIAEWRGKNCAIPQWRATWSCLRR